MRLTERQTDTQTNRQKDKQSDKWTVKIEKERERGTDYRSKHLGGQIQRLSLIQ